MQNRNLPMSIRELNEEDKAALAGMDEPPCAWEGCNRDARWEVAYEDLQDTEDLTRSGLGLKTEAAKKRLPVSEIVAVQTFRSSCDEHARRFYLEGSIELPANLAG